MFFSVNIPHQIISDFYSARIFICILRIRQVIVVVDCVLITDDAAPVVELEILVHHHILLELSVILTNTSMVSERITNRIRNVVFAVITAAVVSCWFCLVVLHNVVLLL